MKKLVLLILSTVLVFSCSNSDSNDNKSLKNKAFVYSSDSVELDRILTDFKSNGQVINHLQVYNLLNQGYNLSKGDYFTKNKMRNYDHKIPTKKLHCNQYETYQAVDVVLKNDSTYFYVNEKEYLLTGGEISGDNYGECDGNKNAVQSGPLKVYKYNKSDFLTNIVMQPPFIKSNPAANIQYLLKKNQMLLYYTDVVSEGYRKSDDRYAELYTFGSDNKILSIVKYTFSYVEKGLDGSTGDGGQVWLWKESESKALQFTSDLSFFSKELKNSYLCTVITNGTSCSLGDHSNLVN